MPTIPDADLRAIFSDPIFSECATFTLNDGSQLCVNCMFNDASDEVLMFGQVQIEAQSANLVVKSADVAAVRNKNVVTARDAEYQVERIQKTGAGSSVVYLKTGI